MSSIKATQTKKKVGYKRPKTAPLQIPLSTQPIIVVPKAEVSDAWIWLSKGISGRPNIPESHFFYDHKKWRNENAVTALQPDSPFVDSLACLYLTAQLGDFKSILYMANGEAAPDIIVSSVCLDPDVRVVINSESRFRNALSEHLAFWVQLATIAKTPGLQRFGCSLPNFQPEDKGPDGLSMSLGVSAKVEIYSVKNSISNPSQLVTSGAFKTKGRPTKGKLLDDFWLSVNNGWGIGRLDRLLDHVCMPLNFSPDQALRFGLIGQCAYNAVIVADDKFGKVPLFNGFHRVTTDINRRVATYIGSTKWRTVAEKARCVVKKSLALAGVK